MQSVNTIKISYLGSLIYLHFYINDYIGYSENEMPECNNSNDSTFPKQRESCDLPGQCIA